MEHHSHGGEVLALLRRCLCNDLAEMGETVDFFGDDASNGAGLFSTKKRMVVVVARTTTVVTTRA